MQDKNLLEEIEKDWDQALLEDERKEIQKGNVSKFLINMRATTCNAFTSDMRFIKMYYQIAYKNSERSKYAFERNDIDALNLYYEDAKSALDKSTYVIKGLKDKANSALEDTRKINTNNSKYIENKINKLLKMGEDYYLGTESLVFKTKDYLEKAILMQDTLQQ